MKSRRARGDARIVSVLAVALLTGCTKELVQVSEPIGPAPIVRPSPTMGRLIVDTEEEPPYGDVSVTAYKSYTIFDSSGRLVEQVSNDSGADIIQLEAGRYSVRAERLKFRVTAVDVQIVAGTTTEVHLDGYWKPKPNAPGTIVRGPGGSPIGYRFEPTTAPPVASTAPSREEPARTSSQ